MPKRDDDTAGVAFDVNPQTFEDLGRPSSRKRGPDPDPESLRSQVAEGRAKHLKLTIPTDLHRRLHVLSVMTDRTISELVAEALEAHYPDLKR